MSESGRPPSFTVSQSGESGGKCDCCGHATSCIWGVVDAGETTVSAYWIRWTVAHPELDVSIDLCLGAWGDATMPADRNFVFLLYRQDRDGRPSIGVIDPKELLPTQRNLADRALRRDEVIGTPLAAQVFALVDAILLQDSRLRAPNDEEDD